MNNIFHKKCRESVYSYQDQPVILNNENLFMITGAINGKSAETIEL